MMSKLLSLSTPASTPVFHRSVNYLVLAALTLCCSLTAVQSTLAQQCIGNITITNNPVNVPRMQVNCPGGDMTGDVTYSLSFVISVPTTGPMFINYASAEAIKVEVDDAPWNGVWVAQANPLAGNAIPNGALLRFTYPLGKTYNITIGVDGAGAQVAACPPINIVPGLVSPNGTPSGAVCFPNAPTGFPDPDVTVAGSSAPIYLCPPPSPSGGPNKVIKFDNTGVNGVPSNLKDWSVSNACATVSAGGDGTNSVSYDFTNCAPGTYWVTYCETGGGVITASCEPNWTPQPQPCKVCDTFRVVILSDPDITTVPTDASVCSGSAVGPYNVEIAGTDAENANVEISWTVKNTLAPTTLPADFGTASSGKKKGEAGNEIAAFNATNSTNDNINAQFCFNAARILPDGTVCNDPDAANCDFDLFVCATPKINVVDDKKQTICSGTSLDLAVHSSLSDGSITNETTEYRWYVLSNNGDVSGENALVGAGNATASEISTDLGIAFGPLTNNTASNQTITIRVFARNGDEKCDNCAETVLDITVTILPVVAVNVPADITYCPEDPVNLTFSTTPVGGTISWSSSVAFTQTGDTQGGPTNLPVVEINGENAAVNNTGSKIEATVTVTADNPAPCADDTETFKVTICPEPVLTAPPVTVCSGQPIVFTVNSNLNADQTAFRIRHVSVVAHLVPDIGNPADRDGDVSGEETVAADRPFATATGGRHVITQTATGDIFQYTTPAVTNNTNVPQTFTYQVVGRNADCNTCGGLGNLICPTCESEITVTVTVLPDITVTGPTSTTFCSNNRVATPPPAVIPGSGFTTTPGPGNVAVNYTITGGAGFANAAAAADALGIPVTGQFPAGGNIAITIPENKTANNLTVTFSLSAANDCNVTPFTYTVIIRPEPNFTPITDQRICSGGSFPGAEIVINNRGADLGAVIYDFMEMNPACSPTQFNPTAYTSGNNIPEDDNNTTVAYDRPAAAGPYTNNTANSQSRRYAYTLESAFGCLSTEDKFDAIVDPTPVFTSGTFGPVCSGARVNINLNDYKNPGGPTAVDFSWTAVAVPAGSVMGFTANQPVGVPTLTINDKLLSMIAAGGTVVYTVTPYSLSGDCTGADVQATRCAGTPFTVTVTVTNDEFKIPDILTPDGPYCDSDPCVDLLNETQVNLSTIAASLGPDVNWRWLVNGEVFHNGNATGPLAALYVAPGPAASHGGFNQGPSGAVFCPNIAGPGVHIVCLEFFEDANNDGVPDPNGCITQDCRTFLVYPEFKPDVMCPSAICVSANPQQLMPVFPPDFNRPITFGLAGGPAYNPTVAMSQTLDPQGNVVENEAYTVWSGAGVTNPFNSPNAMFDPLAAVQQLLGNLALTPEMLTAPIVVPVQYAVGYDQCRKYGTCNIEVVPTNVAVVNDLAMECAVDPQGQFDMSSLLGNNQYNKPSTPGGVWSVTGPAAEVTGSNLSYNGPGCYEIKYDVKAGICPAVFDNGFIQVKEKPAPVFEVDEMTVCKNSSDLAPIRVTTTSPSYKTGVPTYEWTIVENGGVTVDLFDANTSTPTIRVIGTDADGGSVDICLKETLAYDACGNFPEGTCEATYCITVQVMAQPLILCPPNITVNNDVDQCGAVVNWELPTASDDCGVVTPRLESLFGPNTYFTVGTHTIKYAAGDPAVSEADSPFSYCSFDVTVQDVQKPLALCRDQDLILDALTGTAVLTVPMVNAGSTDNCAIDKITLSKENFDCSNKGQNVITMTVEDENGNMASCNATINVMDMAPPTITKCPDPITVNDCDDLVPNMIPSLLASDNCDNMLNFVITQNPVAGTDFGQKSSEQVVVTFTVTDKSGNSSTCQSSVTIVDDVKPKFTNCPANIIVGNDVDKCGANVFWTAPSATDNCPGVAVALTSSATTTAPGTLFPVATTTVTYTATDAVGNFETCQFSVTVTDMQTPTAVCKDITVNLPAISPVEVTVNAADVNGGSTDNCTAAANLVLTPASQTYTCANLGDNNYTLTVTDAAGNKATCVATVTVRDVTKPTLTCPQNFNVNDCDDVVTNLIPNTTIADNCTAYNNLIIVQDPVAGTDFGQFSGNSVVVTVSATDASGNTGTCTTTITIVDGDKPVIACPGNIVVGASVDKCEAVVTYSIPTATDNCVDVAVTRIQGQASGTVFPVGGPYTVEYQAKDDAGNVTACAFTITVLDQQMPKINCPGGELEFNVNAGTCTWAGIGAINASASDNCAVTSLTYELSGATTVASAPGNTSLVGVLFNLGTTTVTWTARDAAGNTITCRYRLTVVDNIVPTISTCPPARELNTSLNGAGDCTTTVPNLVPEVVASDNCSGSLTITQYPTAGTTIGAQDGEQTQVIITVRDANGNVSTCLVTLTVNDDEKPGFVTCPSNMTLNADVEKCGTNVFFSVPVATDNCGLTTVTRDQGLTPGAFFPVGPTTQTYTANDGRGNTTSCTFTVTVLDVQKPSAVCKDITVDLNAIGQVVVNAANVDGGSSDNCTTITLLPSTPTTYTCANIGNNNYTLTVRDAAGNTAVCVATVTVRDVTRPTITVCPASRLVPDCDDLVPNMVPSVTATDNCGSVTIAQNPVPGVDFGKVSGSSVVVTFTATDGSGNSTTCSATITITDTDRPVFTNCPANINVGNDVDKCGANVTFLAPSAVDNCIDLTVVGATSNLATGALFPVGTTPMSYTATDVAGNVTTCSFTVTVTDMQMPKAVCKDLVVQLNPATGTVTITAAQIDGGSSDNCGVTSVVASKTTFTCADAGENNVTLTVKDAAGNTSICVAEVTVDQTGVVQACTGTLFSCPAEPFSSKGWFTLRDLDRQVVTCWPEPNANDYLWQNGIIKVTYYLSELDAQLKRNPVQFIDIPQQYPSRNFWARAENAAGCYDIDIVNTVVFDSPVVTLDVTDESCRGAIDGKVKVTVVSGPPSYYYQWSTNPGVWNGPTPNNMSMIGDPKNFVALAPGVYTVTVKDGHGCTVSATGKVEEGRYLNVVAPKNITVCPGEMVPNLELHSTPLGLPVDYRWTVSPAGSGLADGAIWIPLDEIPMFRASTKEGVYTVTVIGQTIRGCQDDDTFTITILDDKAPVFTVCPQDRTVNNDVDKCGTFVEWLPVLATDNCQPNVVITQTGGPTSGSFLNVATTPYTVTYVADDLYGNTAKCEFKITVLDMQAPTANCPSGAQYFGTNGGNCSWTAPAAATLNATASDNCSVTSLTHNVAGAANNTTIAGVAFPLGGTMVVWTATDASGNQSTCSYRIVVADDDAPTVTACPSNITRSNDAGVCGAVVSYTVSFADNCGGTATLVDGLASGSTFPVGTTQVEWSYNDAASNGPVYCAFTVTVNDTENPKVTCPANVVVGINGTVTSGTATLVSSGPCGVTLSYTAPVGTDNCPGVVTTNASGLGAGPNFYEYGGFYTETYNVFDNAGNKVSCSFSITVLDPVNPTITCPENTTVTTDIGECDTEVSYSFPYAGDNCPGYSITKLSGLNSGAEFPLGTSTVSFRVTDPTGNTKDCTFSVTVQDRERPVITFCPPPTTANTNSNGTGDCSGGVPNMAAQLNASDNCSAFFQLAISQTPTAGTAFGAKHGDVQLVTFFVSDASGNTSSCTSTVRLVDNEAPSIVCTGLTTVFEASNPGICGRLIVAADNVNPSFSDNCEGAKRRHNFPTAPSHWTLEGAILPVGNTVVVWTITDINGNTTACSVTYTVTDKIAPVFVNCPQNITVGNDVDKCGSNVFWTAPIAQDACGAFVTQTVGLAPGSLFPAGASGPFTISWIGSSVTGNGDGWNQDQIMQWKGGDTYELDITLFNGEGKFRQNRNWGVNWGSSSFPSGTGFQDGPNLQIPAGSYRITFNRATGAFSFGPQTGGAALPAGTSQICYRAVDPSGNTASCCWTITVTDMQLPDIQCPSGIQEVNTNVACTHVVSGTALNASASDNCGIASLTHNYTNNIFGNTTLNQATFPLGSTTVRWTAVDNSGLSRTCTFVVLVRDLTDPTVQSCPANVNTIADVNQCAATITYNVPVRFQDNCDGGDRVGTLIQGLGTSTGGTFPVGTTTVVWRYTDAASNDFAECLFTVTVRDFTTPVISCPTNITVNTDGTLVGGTGGSPLAGPSITSFGPCGVNLRYTAPVGTDNCPNPTTVNTSGFGSGTNYYAYNGVYTETWRVTDASGNSASCAFTITVLDPVAPKITCPSSTTVSNDPGECDAVVDYAYPYYSDNCTNFTLTKLSGPDSGQEFIVGTTAVSFRVTDNAGNSTNCSFTVTVEDREKPVITTCPADRTVATTSNGAGDCTGAVPNLVPEVVATDNCTIATITQSPAAGSDFGGAHGDKLVVTITVTDIYGNKTTCTVVLTLVDTERPSISCAAIPTALSNTTDYCDYFVRGTELNPTFSDNCGPLTLTNTLTGNNTLGGTSLPLGSTSVTWTVTDANGNTSACAVTYVVSDTQAPVAVCQGPQIDVVLDGDGFAQLLVSDVNNGSYDNCQVITSNIKREDSNSAFGQSVTFSCADIFTVTTLNREGVVLEVRDQAGNITRCTTSVTVLDVESPVITCPNGIETVTDPALCTAIVNGIGLQYSHDNCATTTTYTITGATTKSGNNDASGTVFNKGFSTVTYTVVDASGNAANCSFDVEVEDEELPVINCGNITNLIRSNTTNQCGYIVSGTEFDPTSFSDNCPGATIRNNYNNSSSLAGADFPVGTTNVVWTVTDASGNTITCVSKVTINDTQIPTITCPTAAATQFTNDLGQCAKTILTGAIDPGFGDNCPGAGITHNYVTAPNPWTLAGATFPVGTTNVIWTVTDKAGNSTTCAISVVVRDTEAPEFVNCPTTMIMVGNDVDKCSAKVNWPTPVAEDNCDVLSVTQISGPGSGTEIAVGAPFTVTFRAVDVNGNSRTCSFQVQVVDTQKPQFDADIVMPADATVECDNIPAAFVLTNNDVFDNCTPSAQLVIKFTETSTKGTNPALCSFYDYVITRTWTVTDAAGNVLAHTQVLTVKDRTAPVARCKNLTVTLDKAGNVSITGADVNNGSTDNCAAPANLTYTVTPNTFGCANLGANTVVLRVTDPCGNSATCTATVTVVEGIGKCTPEYDLARSVKCECKNNATTLDNGQFNEVIQVWALAMQTWTLTANDGLFASNSPAPPAAPNTLALNTALTAGTADGIDNDKDGAIDEADEMVFYTLRGIHVEGKGYTVTLKNAAGQSLTISNKCYYPTPIFENLDDPFCLNTPPFVIKVGENYGASGTVTSITINGAANTTFDATKLGIGQHKIAATFDAGTATPFITVNGKVVSGSDEAALKDPGCQQMIMQFVQVVGTPSQVVCNDLLHVSLEADCNATINPDDVMEGSYFCYDDYKVELDKTPPMGNGPWVPAVLTTADIGKKYFYRVTHPISGNICWGEILVEDKLPPALTCPTDKQILCTQSEENLSLTGTPTWTDCSNVTLIRQDDYQQFTCAENKNVFTRVLRTWVATDQWGNSTTCLQVIDMLRGKVNQVTFPADKEYVCNAAPSSFEPNVTGWPTVGGVAITTNGSGACGLSVSYTDEEAAVCPGSFKIIRTWKITDWCTATGQPDTRTEIQYIKVTDAKPTIDFSNFNYDADNKWYTLSAKSAFGGQCVASGPLPIAIIKGECNNVVTVKITTSVGNVNNGGLIPAPGLSLGLHQIKYFVEDECGNITSETITVNVIDDVPPVAACDQFTQVALTQGGESIVKAETFDDKSWDNCCLEGFQVRRMNSNSCTGTDFGPDVKFCCSDIGDTIQVVFRVTDCNKNENDCMVFVEVVDKVKPLCTAPANVTTNCENFDPSLWAYGFATGEDNCCIDTITVQTSYAQFDTLCNRGTITRTFRAFDCATPSNSSQCVQRIFVNFIQDYFVKFPDDRIITVCDGTGNYGEPTFFGKDCEYLAVSSTDEVFTVVPDACFKIERTWHIINWCTYNVNGSLVSVPNPNPNATVNAPANNPGPIVSAPGTPSPWQPTVVKVAPNDPTAFNYSVYYTGGVAYGGVQVPAIATSNGFEYKQIIKVLDSADPVIENCPASPVTVCDLTNNNAELWNEMYWWDNTISSHDLCEGPTDLNITATDACSGANVTVRYLLFLDLDGDGTMETLVNSNDLGLNGLGWNNIRFGSANGAGTNRAFDERPVPANQKYGFALQLTKSGTKVTAAVRWNTQQSPNTFVVPELPYGTHKIKWIVEDGCGNESICEYTFIVKDCKVPTVVCYNGLSGNIMPTKMLTVWANDFLKYGEDNCTPANQLVYSIQKKGGPQVFPRDAQGNPITSVTFTCQELGTQEVELWAIDKAGNAGYCTTYFLVQDPFKNCDATSATIAGALMTEEQKGLEEASVEISGGKPGFQPVSVLSDKDGAYMFQNVPSQADYTVTPVKDVNPLNGVSTYDLVLISKHILGLEPLSSPYKMIAADANKSNSITTLDIVELRKLILGIYTELPNNTSWRFVDGAYSFPNPLNPFEQLFPEDKKYPSLAGVNLGQNYVALKVGDVNASAVANSLMSSEDRALSTLLFDLDDRTVTAGEVFEVNFKAAERVQGYQFTMNIPGLQVLDVIGGAEMKSDNFATFADAFTTSFDGNAKGEFTVRFKALKGGKLSQMLNVSSRITRAEAYSLGGERQEVALRYNGSTITGVGFELYQNEPNPFINKTMIGFHLPEATEATLRIFDETGRTLFTQKGNFAKGYNSIAVERALLNTTGLMYYSIETATDSATKKMIQTK